MATTKTKPDSTTGQKPWDRLGITYQQWYYRNKAAIEKGDLPLSDRLAMIGEKANAASAEDNKEREQILLTDFLDRCEQSSPGGMDISAAMRQAIYNILRQDGH